MGGEAGVLRERPMVKPMAPRRRAVMVTRVMAMMVGVSLREGVVMEVPCLLISVLVG